MADDTNECFNCGEYLDGEYYDNGGFMMNKFCTQECHKEYYDTLKNETKFKRQSLEVQNISCKYLPDDDDVKKPNKKNKKVTFHIPTINDKQIIQPKINDKPKNDFLKLFVGLDIDNQIIQPTINNKIINNDQINKPKNDFLKLFVT